MADSDKPENTEPDSEEDPEEDSIRDLTPVIQELERSAEQTKPQIQFRYNDDAGPDFYVLRANSGGLYGMAAALLRLAQNKDTSDASIDEYLTDLTDGGSDMYVGSVVRFDGDSPDDESMAEGSSCWSGIGCFLLLASIPVFWIIGFYSFLSWLFG